MIKKAAVSIIIFMVLFMAFWHIHNEDREKRFQTRTTDSNELIMPISAEDPISVIDPIFKPRQYIQVVPK
ncbi:MAG TPA: hypothetical protein VEY51_09920 [Chondromyces sp.]|nr:hypothetical protein [Chondromyces sp.]